MILGVNIDHVATLRQLRAGLVQYPNILDAAKIAVENGADQITIHLRGDRRHIQEDDLAKLSEASLAPINLELAATDEMLVVAKKYKPEIVCLVPEKREEITTEGGLDVVRFAKPVKRFIEGCHEKQVKVSLFIEPDEQQIVQSSELRADAVEFHTGQYALAKNTKTELERLKKAFIQAHELGLAVHAGHGLDYENTKALVRLPHLEELNIGHSIVCRAVIVGLGQAVREMKDLIEDTR